MKTKFKDLLLYSLATIGVVALFISATQEISYTQTHGTPESHVWEGLVSPMNNDTFIFNKKTGEVRGMGNGPDKRGQFIVMKYTP